MGTDLIQDDVAHGARNFQLRGRQYGRYRCIRLAQIAFGGSVYDCVLLNASPFGASVCLRQFTEVPSVVTLRLPGGECQSVQRKWQNGLHVGFEAVGTAPLKLLAA